MGKMQGRKERGTGLSTEALAKVEDVAHPLLCPPPSRGRKNMVVDLSQAADCPLSRTEINR